jgi:hypothetical protein
MGDNAARVKVRVTDERGHPYHECRTELLSSKNRQVLYAPSPDPPFPDPRPLGTFITTFILPPGAGLYLMRVACEGSNETFTSEPTMLPNPDTTFSTPVDLGTVQLKRFENPRN